MKLKINKACDLSSISVLPRPQSRRSSMVPSAPESSSIYGRSQATSQIRQQQSQLTLSQGVSSQHGLFSQFSQNSQDEILTNELKLGSQERENSVRRSSYLAPISYPREESSVMVSRTSNNFMRRRSGEEHKCQISEELEHRIGVIESSLSRLGMILDSVQNDIIQVNKCTKEVSLDMKAMRQKLIVQDDTLQSMSKGQDDIKTCLDTVLKSVSDQLKQVMNQQNLGEIISNLEALSKNIDSHMVKLQNDLQMDFRKEMQAISCSMKISEQKQAVHSTDGPKAVSFHASPQECQFPNKYVLKASVNSTRSHLKEQQTSLQPKNDTGGWTSVKKERATSDVGNLTKINQIKASPKPMVQSVIIDSDEETDEGFSCLFEEKGIAINEYSVEQARKETARILRKARRKRKHCNTIIIN